MEIKVHYLELGAGDITLCNDKLVVVNKEGRSISEIYGGAYTFSKQEVTCEKCKAILNKPYSRFIKN